MTVTRAPTMSVVFRRDHRAVLVNPLNPAQSTLYVDPSSSLTTNQGMRVLPLNAVDASLDRDAQALIVENRMAVMCVCG